MGVAVYVGDINKNRHYSLFLMSAYGAYVKRKIGDVIFQRVYKYEIPEICHTLLLDAKSPRA